MALFRALESARPREQRLFEDSLARIFLRPRLAALARLAAIPVLGSVAPWLVDRWAPGARSSGIARTRFIDDAIRSALAEGIEQLVILGAGFDCRAYRLPGMAKPAIFEVDHPDTSRAKQEALQRAGVARPANVHPVTMDFGRNALGPTMAAAGYREAARTFVLWEGVTNYLTEAAVQATLHWCAKAAPGSWLLFTYVHRRVIEEPRAFFGAEMLFRALEAFQERWTFGIAPSELGAFLAPHGLALECDVGAADYRQQYFGQSAAHMRGYEFCLLSRICG
jgi:methyltransferase (TIGR00027 family)